MKIFDIKIQCSELHKISLGDILYRNLQSQCKNYTIFFLVEEYAVIPQIYKSHEFYYFFDSKSQQLFEVLQSDNLYIEEPFLEYFGLCLVKNNSKKTADLIFNNDISLYLRIIFKFICETYLIISHKIFMFLNNRGGKEPILNNQYARFLFTDFQIQHKNMQLLSSNEINDQTVHLFNENLQKIQQNLIKLSGGRAYLLGDIHHINYCISWIIQIYFSKGFQHA